MCFFVKPCLRGCLWSAHRMHTQAKLPVNSLFIWAWLWHSSKFLDLDETRSCNLFDFHRNPDIYFVYQQLWLFIFIEITSFINRVDANNEAKMQILIICLCCLCYYYNSAMRHETCYETAIVVHNSATPHALRVEFIHLLLVYIKTAKLTLWCMKEHTGNIEVSDSTSEHTRSHFI